MPSKKCSKCGESKDLEMFCKKSKSRDGLNTQCRQCTGKTGKAYRIRPGAKKPRKRQRSAWDIKNQSRYNRMYPEARARARAKWLEENPGALKAQRAVSNAVRDKRLSRVSTLTCHHCGQPAQEYHHHLGYAPEHALDVIPLCRACHKKV